MISVIINNYNYGRFIGDAIQSVLDQTYDNWELIIVDDGSTDDSKPVIERYIARYPDRIRAILKENGGQASCFNVGFDASSGNIIAFLDSDDYWYPSKLEMIAKAHDSYDYVAHGKNYSNGAFYKADTIANEKRSYYLKKYGVIDSYDLTTSVLSFSRSLLSKILPMPEQDYIVCADQYVKMAALYYENVYYIEQELSCYRIHGSNAYVSKSIEERSSVHDERLLFISKEYFNKSLLQKDSKAKIIPHRSIRLTDEFYKEIGNGFEISKGGRYIVYGTGNDSVKMIHHIVEREGIIVAFCDSDKNKQGHLYYGKKVLSPESLIDERSIYDKIVIASLRYYRQMANRLETMDLKRGSDYIFTPVY